MSKTVTSGQYKTALIVMVIASILLFLSVGHLVAIATSLDANPAQTAVMVFPIAGIVAFSFAIAMSTVTVHAYHKYGNSDRC